MNTWPILAMTLSVLGQTPGQTPDRASNDLDSLKKKGLVVVYKSIDNKQTPYEMDFSRLTRSAIEYGQTLEKGGPIIIMVEPATTMSARDLEVVKVAPQLRVLRLGSPTLPAAALGVLKHLPLLEELEFGGESCTDQALEKLSPLSNLSKLNLSFSTVTGTGFSKSLAARSKCLVEIELMETEVNDTHLEMVMAIPSLKSVNILWCDNISDAGFRAAKVARPDITFSR